MTMVTFQSISTDEYRKIHNDFKVLYAFCATPFGKCLIGITSTEKAIVHLVFVDKNENNALENLRLKWPLSVVTKDESDEAIEIANIIFSKDDNPKMDSLTVLVKGTEFQTNVWQSLLLIPKGTTTTYEHIAQAIGKPKAARAVGNAIAKNQIAYLIPCHRVMGKTGGDKYTWGTELRQNILKYEQHD